MRIDGGHATRLPPGVVIRGPAALAWTGGFVATRMLLGGYVGPAAGSVAPVGTAKLLGPGPLSFLWVPAPHTFVLVWWPAWLGALAMGVLLGVAVGVRRIDGTCGTARWSARSGRMLAGLAGLGCCGMALSGLVFAGSPPSANSSHGRMRRWSPVAAGRCTAPFEDPIEALRCDGRSTAAR